MFQDAVTSPLILLVNKSKPIQNTKFLQINTLKDLNLEISILNDSIELNPKVFNEEKWNLISEKELSIIKKVSENHKSIAELDFLDIKRGLLTGLNDAFIIDDETKESIKERDPKSIELIKKFIDGDDVRKYQIRTKNKHLICIPNGYTDDQEEFMSEEDAFQWLMNNYPGIANYLKEFEFKAKNRSDKGRYWWELRACDYYDLIESKKIIYPEIAMSSRFAFDDNNIYINKTIFLINSSSYGLLGLLNSKLIWYYLINTCASLGDPKNGGRLNMQRIYLETIGIPNEILNNESKLSEITKVLNGLYQNYNNILDKYRVYIQSSMVISKLSKKLENWYELEFGEFIKELNKAIKATNRQMAKDTAAGINIDNVALPPLTKKDEFEWLELFEENKKKAQELLQQIAQTEKEIDLMVYALYGLAPEEIEIVENS